MGSEEISRINAMLRTLEAQFNISILLSTEVPTIVIDHSRVETTS